MTSRAALLLVSIVAACGATPPEDPEPIPVGEDDVGQNEEETTDDAADEFGPTDCVFSIVDRRGEIDATEDTNSFYIDSSDYWLITITLEPSVYLDVRLRKGKGSLAGGIGVGRYPIQGADTVYEDCALCASIRVTNVDGYPRYMAKLGTLEITEYDEAADTIHGSFLELALEPYKLTHIIGSQCSAHDQCGNSTCYTSFEGGGRCYVSVPEPNRCPTSIGRVLF